MFDNAENTDALERKKKKKKSTQYLKCIIYSHARRTLTKRSNTMN